MHEVAALQPLRGGKNRETGTDGEDSDSGVATINSRIVGVQRMIKNSKIICRQRRSGEPHRPGLQGNDKNWLDHSANQFA